MSLMRERACVASTMPPAMGTAPPVRPVPPARGVTGTSYRSATSRVAATSAALDARTTAEGAIPSMSLSSDAYVAHPSAPVSTRDAPSRCSSSRIARSTDARGIAERATADKRSREGQGVPARVEMGYKEPASGKDERVLRASRETIA